MKNYILLFSFLNIIFNCISQVVDNEKLRIEKYWRYRENFNQHFIVKSPDVNFQPGAYYPATHYTVDENGNPQTLNFDDGNANLSQYLMMLATEYKALELSGQSTQATLNELYMALLCFERLDEYSESWSRYRRDNNDTDVRPYGYHSFEDANGWYIRGDMDKKTFEENRLKLGGFPGFESLGDENDGIKSELTDGISGPAGISTRPQSMSQDLIFNLLMGLALVKKLVPEIISCPVINHSGNVNLRNRLGQQIFLSNKKINISKWVDDIVYRLMSQLKHQDGPTYFLGHSPNNPFECETIFFWLNNPLCEVLNTRWFLKYPNSVETNKFNEEGSGSDWSTYFCFSNGVCNAANSITGENYHGFSSNNLMQREIFDLAFRSEGPSQILQNINSLLPYSLLFPNFFPYNAIVTAAVGGFTQALTVAREKAYYKCRNLGTISGHKGSLGFNTISNWEMDEIEPYEHFPLIWLLLHPQDGSLTGINPNSITEVKKKYLNLLNLAPCFGNRNYFHPTNGFNDQWSSVSRINWPERRNSYDPAAAAQRKELWGMDFMILNNLYCISFGEKLYKLETKPLSTSHYEPIIPLDINNYIYKENGVTVESAEKVRWPTEYTASKSITLKSGFRAYNNNFFNGKIGGKIVPNINSYSTDNACISGPLRMAVSNDLPEIKTEIEKNGTFVKTSDRFYVFPNPAFDNFSVFSEKPAIARLLNSTGKIIKEFSIIPGINQVSSSGCSPGIYFLYLDGNFKTKISIVK